MKHALLSIFTAMTLFTQLFSNSYISIEPVNVNSDTLIVDTFFNRYAYVSFNKKDTTELAWKSKNGFQLPLTFSIDWKEFTHDAQLSVKFNDTILTIHNVKPDTNEFSFNIPKRNIEDIPSIGGRDSIIITAENNGVCLFDSTFYLHYKAWPEIDTSYIKWSKSEYSLSFFAFQDTHSNFYYNGYHTEGNVLKIYNKEHKLILSDIAQEHNDTIVYDELNKRYFKVEEEGENGHAVYTYEGPNAVKTLFVKIPEPYQHSNYANVGLLFSSNGDFWIHNARFDGMFWSSYEDRILAEINGAIFGVKNYKLSRFNGSKFDSLDIPIEWRIKKNIAFKKRTVIDSQGDFWIASDSSNVHWVASDFSSYKCFPYKNHNNPGAWKIGRTGEIVINNNDDIFVSVYSSYTTRDVYRLEDETWMLQGEYMCDKLINDSKKLCWASGGSGYTVENGTQFTLEVNGTLIPMLTHDSGINWVAYRHGSGAAGRDQVGRWNGLNFSPVLKGITHTPTGKIRKGALRNNGDFFFSINTNNDQTFYGTIPFVDDYVEQTVSIKIDAPLLSKNKIDLVSTGTHLTVTGLVKNDHVRIELFQLNGRRLLQSEMLSLNGVAQLLMPSAISQGLYIARISHKGANLLDQIILLQ